MNDELLARLNDVLDQHKIADRYTRDHLIELGEADVERLGKTAGMAKLRDRIRALTGKATRGKQSP